ncbi:outer membrane lipoprotein-sorting protein [Cerasicoccus arenae]|uniref:outer membrane lipoprotein-sorting protein n=1 Tax=Cerasicoccus arenae TaxID=424488 RepID=UPI001905D046|nr:outer membrane lipoprotein-sorting protein [Cerasicoccus arenae]
MSPEDRARELIQRTEGHFGIREHAELYRYVRATSDGEIYDGHMLIIFRYEKDEVNGVFRLLPDNDNEGVTLISQQLPGKLPALGVYDHNKDTGGPVETEELHQKLGDTDWFFEGIYDDDKNPWTYRNTGSITYRGTSADVIEATYSDKRLKDAVGYDHRRILIRQSDDQPLSSEFYNSEGQLIYVIDLLGSEHFEYQGKEQARTKQLQLIDFDAGSTTVFTRIRSNWNPQLPADIFELDFAPKWDKSTDDMVVSKLLRDQPAN